ncbi:MAG TPA: IclR family transcriptional regulator [Nocardioidaceae bacterium]|nr:IclR family transcriptional regulator [Nocardioidaceae bacterium]
MSALAGSDRTEPARSTRVQSVDRAVALLRAVARASGSESTVTALAAACGLNRATAWRILTTLEAQGMVVADRETGRFRIGFGVVELAGAAGADALVRAAHPMLERVCRQAGETAALAVLDGRALKYVDEVAPTAIVAAIWRGREVPLHATSTGKALLAFSEPAEVERMTGPRLERFTKTTITSRAKLRAELDRTRERGYGVCRGEYESSAWGVSAPMLDSSGRPLAILSIWGPANRVTDARFEALGEIARDAAASISHP